MLYSRPGSGAARQMQNLVANEDGYASYCCTEVTCFTVAVDRVKEYSYMCQLVGFFSHVRNMHGWLGAKAVVVYIHMKCP